MTVHECAGCTTETGVTLCPRCDVPHCEDHMDDHDCPRWYPDAQD